MGEEFSIVSVSGLVLLGYIGWLRIRIWYLNQIANRAVVVMPNASGEGQAESRGCATTLMILALLAIFPILMLLRWNGIA